MGSNGSDQTSPLIGVSSYVERARFGVWDTPSAVLPREYLDSVVAAGGVPVLLPPVGDWDADHLSRVDGVVIAGGPDIDPDRYGQPAHSRAGAAQPERDAAELRLIELALGAGVPLLGVCRGMQLLAVSLGGSLVQHLPDRLGTTDHQPAPGRFGPVEVTIERDSLLAGILGRRVTVRCHHHQSVDRLGARLRAVGWADDGTVEAVELPGAGFALGVQWHPEQDRADSRLFAALVERARKGDR